MIDLEGSDNEEAPLSWQQLHWIRPHPHDQRISRHHPNHAHRIYRIFPSPHHQPPPRAHSQFSPLEHPLTQTLPTPTPLPRPINTPPHKLPPPRILHALENCLPAVVGALAAPGQTARLAAASVRVAAVLEDELVEGVACTCQ